MEPLKLNDHQGQAEFLMGVLDGVCALTSKLENEGILSREEIAEGFEQGLRDYSVRADCQHHARRYPLKALAECFRTKGQLPS